MLWRMPQSSVDFINDFRKDQGKYLRVYRAMRNITQQQAANEFGVTRVCWVQWEASKSEMKVNTFVKFLAHWEAMWPMVGEVAKAA